MDYYTTRVYENIRTWFDLLAMTRDLHNAGAISNSVSLWGRLLPSALVDGPDIEYLAREMRDALPYWEGIKCDDATDEQVMAAIRLWARRQATNGPDANSHRYVENAYYTSECRTQSVHDFLGRQLDVLAHASKIDQHTRLVIGTDDKGKKVELNVSYYQDLPKAIRDIRTTTTPERYAARVLGLNDVDARDFGKTLKTLLLDTALDLRFARTIPEIEEVYEKGPNSCMQSSFAHILEMRLSHDGHVIESPVACYATPDFAVAYLQRTTGRITARAVVSEKDKTWARCYGDVEALVAALTEHGYRHETFSAVGCRILHLSDRCGDFRLQPYVDYAGAGFGRKDPYGNNASCEWGQLPVSNEVVNEDGKLYRIVAEPNAYYAAFSNYTYGLAQGWDNVRTEDNDWTCDCCDDTFSLDDDTQYEARDYRCRPVTICEGCTDSTYVLAYDRGEEIYIHCDNVVLIDGDAYSDRSAPDYIYCEHCHENRSSYSEVITNGASETTEQICDDCIEHRLNVCEAIDTNGDTVLALGRECTDGPDGVCYTDAAYDDRDFENANENAA